MLTNGKHNGRNGHKQPILAMPAELPYGDSALRYSGRSITPGSHAYRSLHNNVTFQVYQARITQRNKMISFGQVLHTPAFDLFQIKNSAIYGNKYANVNDVIFITKLSYEPTGVVHASRGWFTKQPRNTPPKNNTKTKSKRSSGIITRIHRSGTFGEIKSITGNDVFFHVDQLRAARSVSLNQRVSFIEFRNAEGWTARDVRPC